MGTSTWAQSTCGEPRVDYLGNARGPLALTVKSHYGRIPLNVHGPECSVCRLNEENQHVAQYLYRHCPSCCLRGRMGGGQQPIPAARVGRRQSLPGRRAPVLQRRHSRSISRGVLPARASRAHQPGMPYGAGSPRHVIGPTVGPSAFDFVVNYSAALSSAGEPELNCSSKAASSALAAARCRCLTWPKPRIFSGIAASPTAM